MGFSKRHERAGPSARLVVSVLLAGASASAMLAAAPAQAQTQTTTPTGAAAAAATADDRVSYAIAAQPLAEALTEYARQSGLSLLVPSARLQGLRAPALQGSFTRQGALDRLLSEAPFSGRINADGAIVLDQAVRLEGGADGDPSAPAEDEIIVTGTRLPGQGPSPVITLGRGEIAESGAANVSQLMATLPQNFGGGPNETTRTGDGANNLLAGSSINLRGLGADSTLVLINGRRISSTGTSNGLFVDVSAIPLSALDRVEVLTDGASAIYGSDAIGGVVNFILRDDFDGAETSARYGAAYDGAAAERGFSQVFGRAGAHARLFGVYDYSERDPLANAERDFAANSDLTRFGGSDFSLTAANPATVIDPVFAAAPRGQDGTALTAGDFILGEPNLHNNNEGQDLLGRQERQSLYLTGALKLGSVVELFGEARGADRSYRRNSGGATSFFMIVPSTHPGFVELAPGATSLVLQYNFIDDLGPVVSSGGNESVGLTGGLRADLGETWRTELTALYGRERGLFRIDNAVNSARLDEALGLIDDAPDFDPAIDGYFNPFGDGANTAASVLGFIRGWAETRYISEMEGFTVQADGEVFNLPAGPLRLAVGAEYRQETFGSRTIEFTSALSPTLRQSPDESRDVSAYFVEARVPLIAPEQNVFAAHRLELTLAGRREDTSNGGADTTPKLGLVWAPVEGLALRTAWGRSFKSPSLTETVAGSQAALVFPIADPASPSGVTTTLILQGTNPGLASETAETWTAGFSLRPPAWEGFGFELNWFRIDFADRIASPANPFTVLSEPLLYAPIIVRDPDDGLVQSYFDAPFFIPIGPTPPASEVGAIVDARLRNLSRSLVSGLDFDLSQRFAGFGGEFTASLSGSYLFTFEQAFSESGPTIDLVDTANNPIDLRLRATLGWRRENLSGAMAINHADDYRDSANNRSVDAWTSADFSFAYLFDTADVEARLNVRNLFNQDPPFLNNPIGVGYDPENADPVGRFVSFALTKTW